MNAWTFLAMAGIVTVWIVSPHVGITLDYALVRAGTIVFVMAPFMVVMAATFLGREEGPATGG